MDTSQIFAIELSLLQNTDTKYMRVTILSIISVTIGKP